MVMSDHRLQVFAHVRALFKDLRQYEQQTSSAARRSPARRGRRNEPRWIDSRGPFAEELEELRLEEEAGWNGDDQHCSEDEVEDSQGPEEDS
jgi:hypothetical protein